ncbi:MAG: glycosyltransferase [Planctomycetota bacterium]
MKILMLTPRFPYPPTRGDTVRSWVELGGLAQRHDVWLACVERSAPPAEHLEHVRRYCRNVAVLPRATFGNLCHGTLSLLAGKSFTEGYFGRPGLASILRQWARSVKFDAVLTFSSSIAPAAKEVGARRRVLDMCDVDSAKWATYARRSVPPLSWLYRLESRRVAELEQRCLHQHDICLLVNERERDKLPQRVPDAMTGVLPTTVDLVDYATEDGDKPAMPAEPVIGMVGSMFYPPNVRAVNWFGRNVWPRVRAALPEARWLIVGSRPSRSVRRWNRLPGVTVTGFVPDVRAYLEQMRVFVNAVDGDMGVQSKLVIALAAGRAAVVTPDSAAGIEYADKPPFLVAQRPRDFADAVIRVASDAALWEQLSTRASQVAVEKYSHQRQLELLEGWLTGQHRCAGEEIRESDTAASGRKLVDTLSVKV